MDRTGDVLRRAGSRNAPPRAVRSTGIEPWTTTCAEPDLSAVDRESVDLLRTRHQGGTLGVICPSSRRPALSAALDADTTVLTPTDAKGLEFDAVLVVDPDAIAAEPRGWNALYVALTRCTQQLGMLRPA